MENYIKYEGTLSLTDASSITVMEELEIYEILAFDSDFDKVEGIIRVY